MSGFDFSPEEIVGECVPSDDFIPYLDCLTYQSDLPLKTSTDIVFGFIFRDNKPLLITRKISDKNGFELQDFFKHKNCERINLLDLDLFPGLPKHDPSLLFLNFFVNDEGLLGKFFDIRNFPLQIVYYDPNPGWEYCKNIPFSDGLDTDQKLLQTLNDIGFCNNSQKDRDYVRSRVSSKEMIATFMGKVKGPGAGQSIDELEYAVFKPTETIKKIMDYLIKVDKTFSQIEKSKEYTGADKFNTFLIWYPEVKSIAYIDNHVVYEKVSNINDEKRAFLELGKHKYGFDSLSKDSQAFYTKYHNSNVFKLWQFLESYCILHKDIFHTDIPQPPKVDLPKPSEKPKPSQTQPFTIPVYTPQKPIEPIVIPPQQTKPSQETGQPIPETPFSFPSFSPPPSPKKPSTVQPKKVEPSPETPFSFPSLFPPYEPKESSTFKPEPSTPPQTPQILPLRPLTIYDVIETREMRVPIIPKISQYEKEEFYEQYREKQFYFETYGDYKKIKLNLNYSNIFVDIPQGTYFVKGQTSEDFETEIVKHMFPDYNNFNNTATNQEIYFSMTSMKRDSGYKILREYIPEKKMNKHRKHDFMVYDYKLSKTEVMQKNFLSLRSAYSAIEIEANMRIQNLRGTISLKIAIEPATLPQVDNDMFALVRINNIPSEREWQENHGIIAYHLQRNGRSFMENKTNALSNNPVELYDYSIIGVLFFLLRK